MYLLALFVGAGAHIVLEAVGYGSDGLGISACLAFIGGGIYGRLTK